MAKERNTLVKISPKDNMKVRDLSRRMSVIQGKNVPSAEVLRRTLNIPNIDKILEEDARMKKRAEEGLK